MKELQYHSKTIKLLSEASTFVFHKNLWKTFCQSFLSGLKFGIKSKSLHEELMKLTFQVLFQSHLLEELQLHFSVIGVTETKITNSKLLLDSYSLIPNYRFEYVPTPPWAGGVGKLLRKNFCILSRLTLSSQSLVNPGC